MRTHTRRLLVPIQGGPDQQELRRSKTDRAAIDELAAFWELQPRVAFQDAARRHLHRALGSACAAHGIACLSAWAARVTIDEIARHPQRDLLRERLPDPPEALDDDWPTSPDGRPGAERGAPSNAGVVVALGSLGPAEPGTLSAVLQDLRRRCVGNAVVVWSHSLVWPERARYVRSRFAEMFDAVDVEVVGSGLDLSQRWYVGSAWTSGATFGATSGAGAPA